MINIELKLPEADNFDNVPYISACCSKIVRDMKLKYRVLKEKISYSSIYSLLCFGQK